MFLIFLTFALFAAAVFVNKQLLFILPPTLFVGIRMLLSGTFLALFTLWQRKNFKNIRLDWLILIEVTLFTVLIPSLLKAYALSRLPAGQASLLGSIDPFVTALYAYILWGEKMSLKKMLGIFLGCLGLWLSINLSYSSEMICMQSILPQLAIIAAVALGRFGWIIVRKLLKKDLYSSAQLNSFVMIFSGFSALCMSSFIDTYDAIRIPAIGTFIFLLFVAVLIGNALGYTLYAHIIKHYNLTLISLAGFSVPLMVSFYEWLFMGRVLTFNFVLALAFLFVGLLIFYFDEIKQQKLLVTK